MVAKVQSGPSRLCGNPKPHASCQLQGSRSKRSTKSANVQTGNECRVRGGAEAWGHTVPGGCLPAWHDLVSVRPMTWILGKFSLALREKQNKTKKPTHTLLEQAWVGMCSLPSNNSWPWLFTLQVGQLGRKGETLSKWDHSPAWLRKCPPFDLWEKSKFVFHITFYFHAFSLSLSSLCPSSDR